MFHDSLWYQMLKNNFTIVALQYSFNVYPACGSFELPPHPDTDVHS